MRSWFSKPSTPPIAEQLALLARYGIGLCPGVTADVIGALAERPALESDGYRATLCALGVERAGAGGRSAYLSDDVWFFDARCIYGPGDYARAVERLAGMLRDDFPAREPADSILLEEWRASVSFELGDTRHHWTQRVLDNWLDETLLVRINQLLDRPDRSPASIRRLWQVPMGGEDRLILAATIANARHLAQECRLAIRQIV